MSSLLLIATSLALAGIAILGCEDEADSPPTDVLFGQYERGIVPPYSDAESNAKSDLKTYAMEKKAGTAPVTVPPSTPPAGGTPASGAPAGGVPGTPTPPAGSPTP
jgi:hypothetical protein